MDGRVGFMVGTLVKRLCTIAWCLTAICAVAWYLQNGIDFTGPDPDVTPDGVYGDVAHRFLPKLMPGMLGVFLAALLASVMSSCDSFMIASSGLFTKNLYQPFRPGRSQRHYVWVGRVTALAVVAGGMAFAYSVEGVVEVLKVWYKLTAIMGVAFWMGLLWRRGNVAGAWASTIAGFVAWLVVTRRAFVDWAADLPFADRLCLTWGSGNEMAVYEPWQIVSYLSAGLAAGVVVSLLTRPLPREQLDRFYTLTRTPIKPGEQITEPCRLPEGVEPADRRMLLTAFGLEVPVPLADLYRRTDRWFPGRRRTDRGLYPAGARLTRRLPSGSQVPAWDRVVRRVPTAGLAEAFREFPDTLGLPSSAERE